MDDYYAARSKVIPPLPWPTFSPPFSTECVETLGSTAIEAEDSASCRFRHGITLCIIHFRLTFTPIQPNVGGLAPNTT